MGTFLFFKSFSKNCKHTWFTGKKLDNLKSCAIIFIRVDYL